LICGGGLREKWIGREIIKSHKIRKEEIMNLSLSLKIFPLSLFFNKEGVKKNKERVKKKKPFWERNFICFSCDDEVPMKDIDKGIKQFTDGRVLRGICTLCSSLWRQEGYHAHAH
jgi:hypothetical protein